VITWVRADFRSRESEADLRRRLGPGLGLPCTVIGDGSISSKRFTTVSFHGNKTKTKKMKQNMETKHGNIVRSGLVLLLDL
jgi:hypothetical protein